MEHHSLQSHGKVELVYEGEQGGSCIVAQNLIGSAVHTFFRSFSKIENLEEPNEKQLTDLIEWFFTVTLMSSMTESTYIILTFLIKKISTGTLRGSFT
jgi:magnesium chelatase subunit I